MKDYETLIFELTNEIEKLEDVALVVEHQIEMAKADYVENNKCYSQKWMSIATYALKKKRMEITRLYRKKADLIKEFNLINREPRQDRFIANLKKLLLETYKEERIKDIFKEAEFLTQG